jgi:hypothetical protein
LPEPQITESQVTSIHQSILTVYYFYQAARQKVLDKCQPDQYISHIVSRQLLQATFLRLPAPVTIFFVTLTAALSDSS